MANRRFSTNRRQFLRGSMMAAAGVTAAGLVGCGDDDDDPGGSTATGTAAGTSTATTPAGAPQTGGKVTYGMAFAIATADPHQNGHLVLPLWHLTGDLLIRQHGGTMVIHPGLAESWERQDDLTATFKLVPNATWQDVAPVNGRAFTSEDVKFSIERMRTDKPTFSLRNEYGDIASIETPDATTVVIKHNTPYAPLIANMAQRNHIMISKEVIDQFTDLQDPNAAIGTGPFILKEWVSQVGHTVTRNPNYFLEGRPYLDEIEVVYLVDDTRRAAAFRTGQIDLLNEIATIDKDSMERQNRDLVFQEKWSGGGSSVVTPNNLKPPMDDPRVRKAVGLAIDRHEIAAAVWQNDTKPMGPLNSTFQDRWAMPLDELLSLPGYRTDKTEDLADAKALLNAAGFGDGLNISTIVNAGFAGYQKYFTLPAAVIVEQLKKIDVDLGLRPLEFGAYNEAYQTGDFDLIVGATANGEDPWSLYVDMHSRNFPYVKDPDLDVLIEKVMTTIDETDRKAACREVERYIVEEQFSRLWTVSTPRVWGGLSKRVQNYDHSRYLNSVWPLNEAWVNG